MGLVASMNRPGGNVTGVSLLAADLETKRIELLRDMVPQTATIYALIDRTDPNVYPETERSRQELQAAAARLGISIQFVSVGADRDLDNAFGELARKRGDWYGDTSPWTERGLEDAYGFRGARSRPAEEMVILDRENPPQPSSVRTVESED